MNPGCQRLRPRPTTGRLSGAWRPCASLGRARFFVQTDEGTFSARFRDVAGDSCWR